MHPILIDFGSFSLHTYGLFMALGFVLAMLWTIHETKRAGLNHHWVPDITISVIVGALLGARLLYIFLMPDYFLEHPVDALMFWKGGLVFSGGLAGGFLAGLWEARRRKQSLLKWLDCVVPGIALGQILGRFGCLSAGCCYGRETTVPWAITFTDKMSLAPLNVALHPTQIYHALSGIFTFLLLVLLRDKLPRTGQRTGLYLVLLAVFRFVVEFYRADFRGTIGPLSTTQITTAAFGLLGLWLLLKKQTQE